MRNKLAVLIGQADESTQRRFLEGFTKRAYEFQYDICVFSLHQKYQETWLRNLGDSNIFELVNYDLFSGVVVMIDTILTKDYAEPLQRKIHEQFHGPVIVIDKESPYFESIMVDHYTPMKKLTDHMIEEHGYTDIAFLGGKEGHPHSVQRLNAFRDSMDGHGIPVREDWIYHGNYWYDSAEEYAKKLLENRDEMPRAIVCANDVMAIGVGTILTENGYKVPEDVAIIGYDSIEDGRCSPAPLTSALIPADECGEQALLWMHSKITGSELKIHEMNAPLFIGASCGCSYKIKMVPKKLRSRWRTQQSSRSMFSEFTHIMEDLLSQNTFEGFWDTVKSYIYQIRPFETFDICMNNTFLDTEKNVGENALRKGYTDTICHVLHCDGQAESDCHISFTEKFAVSDLIPALHEERPYPTTFIFHPLFFDDKCFGYAVLNYGQENRMYDGTYRIWLRDIMQGIEAFYRQRYMQELVERMKAEQVRDSLTGLYNYDGFVKYTSILTDLRKDNNPNQKKLNIYAIDVKGMKSINEIYGRDYGTKVILTVSRFIRDETYDDEVCARMCNDEFLIALLDSDDASRGKEIITSIQKKLKDANIEPDKEHVPEIHYANVLADFSKKKELDVLINYAVSLKNHKKNRSVSEAEASTEQLEAQIALNQKVDKILNQNLLTYVYQPIVSVKDGTIYAYEALMRCKTENIPPLEIIRAAKYLNRLSDVESATFLNVGKQVDESKEIFGEAKVFINSIPGLTISAEDEERFASISQKNSGRFVIEFTEEAQPSDEQLYNMKNRYLQLGNQIAIDDYGAGYSNVNNLLRYMPHYLKIDRDLIADIHMNPQKQHFVQNIVEFSHKNDILVIAEGVETREELKECVKMGVDMIQGYYTGRPSEQPVKAISEEIRNELKRYQLSGTGW